MWPASNGSPLLHDVCPLSCATTTTTTAKTRHRRRTKADSWRACAIELMERRRLLASSLTGELTVTGTKANDTIVIALNASDPEQLDVTLNGDVDSFPLENVENIRVIGLEGRDNIRVDDTNGEVGLEAFLSGGHGNDTITGGAGDETINGANGVDVLTGGAGDDEIEGGRDADSITGGEGEDIYKSSDAATEINDFADGEDGVQIAVADAPLPVQNRINRLLAAESGTKLTGLFRETDDAGAPIFEAEFDQRRFQRSLKILPTGVLEEDELELEIDALPPRVRRAVFAAHPTAEIEEAELRLFARRTFYEVEIFVGDEVRELVMTERGRIVEDNLET